MKTWLILLLAVAKYASHWKEHIRWKTHEWFCERWAVLPFIFSLFSLSPALFLVSLSLILSPRGPRVALPGGLAPNHPDQVGGNQRLPAGCLVTANPWEPHTFLYTQVQHTHRLIYAYQDICCYLLASLHPRLPHNSILPRPKLSPLTNRRWLTQTSLNRY